jgi:hypothetical protein
MKMLNSPGFLRLGVVWGLLVSGFSTGAHSTESQPTLLAQAAVTDCRPGESSMVCCIKKYPWDPVGACAASREEVARVLRALETAHEAVKEDEEEAIQRAKEVAAEEDDPDEGWREHCRDTYVLCRDQKKPRWKGNCYDCFRWCEGQRQWPFHMCRQKTR